MSGTRRVLLTGPVHSIERWADAAREAGWEPIVRPLVTIVPLEVDLAPLVAQPIDWLVVTSSSALPALARDPRVLERARSLPLAVVGEATAARARALGLALALDAAPNGGALAAALLENVTEGALVLWPRGSLADDLARALREGGARVLDPIVYRTEAAPAAEDLPEADAVLFASPSGVQAYAASPRAARAPRTAIATGARTAAAIPAARLAFASTRVLTDASPDDFAKALRRLRASAD